jgi:carbonic anhydrase
MNFITKYCFITVAFILSFGCSNHRNNQTSTFTTWDIIEKTEAMAPKGLKGEFLFTIKNSGKQNSIIYLNTQEDYRDRRNITIALLPSFQRAFNAKHNTDIRSYYENKTIQVKGKAERIKIWFFSQGKRTEKYYFQTHINVSDLNQIKIH